MGWNAYWFRSRPYADLEMVRIITVGTQLILLLFDADYAAARFLQLDASPDVMYQPIPSLIFFIIPFGLDYRPSFEEIQLIKTIAIVSGFLALMGLVTRLSLLVFILSCVFIVAWTYSFDDFHHVEAPLFLALGILVFAPVGRVLSVDAWWRRRRDPERVPTVLRGEHELAGWAIHLIQWLLVLIYMSAVLSKLVFEGSFDWLNGYTLQYYLIQDTLRKGTLLGAWFAQYHYLVMLSQYAVVIFQVTFALAVVFPRLRWLYLPFGLGFHVANWVMLTAPFPEWMALYAVFIPWQRVFAMILRREPEERRGAQLAT
jgi:hypothetical protein